MKIQLHAVSALLLASPGTGGGEPPVEDPSSGLLTIKLADDVTMKFFGRLYIDWGWFTGDEPTYNTDTSGTTPELEDGTEFRTARLGVEGLLYDKTGYKFEFDFAPGTVAAKDVYFTLKELFGTEFRVGHFKEPFSLEQVTSSRFISFMERSLAAAFAPDRNSGFQVGDYNESKTMTWAAGLFRTTNDQARAVGDSEYSYTARLTGTPWYENEGEDVLHLGGAVSYRMDDTVQFRSRPEANMVNRPADTGAIAADDTVLVGLETAWINGPISAQAEYQFAKVSASSGAQDGDFSGYYAYVSYFITGEHRNYKQTSASFDRVRPAESFGGGGKGAIEVLARYSFIDLDDGAAYTDEMTDYTLGVNWYLNGASRVMLNLIHSEFESGAVDDSMDAAMLRFQMDW